ncbi:MAG: hypothetical protein P4L84_27065 [Isosphaeraceae bacterium]|nr:hypothetical protein [Isosphaeraceae bacterium]
MSLAPTHERLELPATLENQLHEFRRRVWSIKMTEAACAAVFGVIVAYLLLFVVDRVWETPAWIRAGLFGAAVGGCAAVPLALRRWVWGHRRLEQLARLLARKHPQVGDQLLGIIELVRDESEQARSRTLCEAAVHQVAEDARRRNFLDAVPNPRHRLWAALAGVPSLVVLGLLILVPAAATNAWARLLAPWKATPRYTFAAFEAGADGLIVPHGEPFVYKARLASSSAWRPGIGRVQLGGQPAVAARLKDGAYAFELPAQTAPGWLDVHIGDFRQRVRVKPMLRPELASVVADVSLPSYLGLPQAQHKDVRGGNITLVKGSDARFTATATRDLSRGAVDGKALAPAGAKLASPATRIDDSRKLEFRWEDAFGLAGKEPFTLAVTSRDDEAPSLVCEDLPRQRVVLDTEQLTFKVKAQDDFGVKRIGIEWRGVESPVVKSPAQGERVLAAGANDKEALEVGGTFSAQSLGIEPQPIHLRVFAEDYFPGRGKVYSSTYTLYVLNAVQHAIWLTEQLSKWHRQSLEVRDRELQLHETNKQLRALASDELDRPETRQKIEKQAAAEQANGRRLTGLVSSGEELVRQAMRNPEFGVGHLEKWAEMLQVLKDIAGNRMPTVADLLKQAAQAPSVASNAPSTPTKMAGQVRSGGGGKPSEMKKGAKPGATVPQVVDRESSQQPPEKNADQTPAKKNPSSPRLTLPVTTLAGKSQNGKPPAQAPAEQKVDEAVVKQQDLLAEFDKIAEELNKVLANLEGSTLVKRLKAASRVQYQVAGRISDAVDDSFGVAPHRMKSGRVRVLDELSTQEEKGSHDVSLIMDDMQSYFERRRFMQFKTVLEEMKKQDVIGSLRQLGDDLKEQNGVSIAQCEFWSDTLDRWAEDLVDPANSGQCPGGKSRSSLPPSIVLEALQILEAEVNLREETRVVQQARAALASSEYGREAGKLSTTQEGLRQRVEKLTQRIRELPDGEKEFGKEIALLEQVTAVMADAKQILARPETGPPAIAAETEAIELLLQSKRINPSGGGGGGSSPGGGGTGSTNDSALALVGGGVNDKEVREDRGISQATGESGPTLPEEFRAGLDEYFNRLERRPSAR